MEPYAEVSVPPRLVAAGMWRRLGALLVDLLLLSLLGFMLELALHGVPAMRDGVWRTALEAALLLAYLAGMGSTLGGGQTLGKRLLRIKIIGMDGGPLSLARAGVRAGILAVPLVAANVAVTAETPVALRSVLALAALGVGPSLAYLWLFNRQGHRSLHDLLTGSFVVPAATYPVPHRSGVWGAHVAIVLGVCAFTALVPLNLEWTPDAALRAELGLTEEALEQLEAVRGRLREMPGATDASVMKRIESVSALGGTKRTSQGVEVVIQTRTGLEAEGAADVAAREVLAGYPAAHRAQFIRVRVQRVRRLILLRLKTHETHSRTPAEWRARLGISGRS